MESKRGDTRKRKLIEEEDRFCVNRLIAPYCDSYPESYIDANGNRQYDTDGEFKSEEDCREKCPGMKLTLPPALEDLIGRGVLPSRDYGDSTGKVVVENFFPRLDEDYKIGLEVKRLYDDGKIDEVIRIWKSGKGLNVLDSIILGIIRFNSVDRGKNIKLLRYLINEPHLLGRISSLNVDLLFGSVVDLVKRDSSKDNFELLGEFVSKVVIDATSILAYFAMGYQPDTLIPEYKKIFDFIIETIEESDKNLLSFFGNDGEFDKQLFDEYSSDSKEEFEFDLYVREKLLALFINSENHGRSKKQISLNLSIVKNLLENYKMARCFILNDLICALNIAKANPDDDFSSAYFFGNNRELFDLKDPNSRNLIIEILNHPRFISLRSYIIDETKWSIILDEAVNGNLKPYKNLLFEIIYSDKDGEYADSDFEYFSDINNSVTKVCANFDKLDPRYPFCEKTKILLSKYLEDVEEDE